MTMDDREVGARQGRIIAVCGECANEVTPDEVYKVSRVPDTARVVLLWECAECLNDDGTAWSQDLFASFVRAHREWYENQPPTTESEALTTESGSALGEMIGRQVQGMRIELDVVETPADMLVIWNDQERYAPWSIKREHGRGGV